MNNLIIGIAGGSGSGKTTLSLRLKERFGEDEVRLISHDSYYKLSLIHISLSRQPARRNCSTGEDAGYPRQDGKTPWSFTAVSYTHLQIYS